jgi:hypothetical protein
MHSKRPISPPSASSACAGAVGACSERGPDGAERNPESALSPRDRSRISLCSFRCTHLIAHAKITFCESFSQSLLDFRLRSHNLSTPFRSHISRQQSRCLNDLQGHCVPNSATAFDNCRRMVLKENIPLTKGRLPEASRRVERVRCSRADLQSAPGRLGHHVSRHYDRGGRCFPGLGQAKAGNARSDHVPGSLA